MSALWQEVLVAVLVAASALFSAWRLASVRARLAALEALGSLPLVRNAAWLAMLRQRTLAGLGAGCGGCAPGGGPAAARGASQQNARNPGRT